MLTQNRDKPPESDSLPRLSVDEDFSMTYSDSRFPETQPPVDLANMPRVTERCPRNVPSNTSVEYQTYESKRISGSPRATPQSPLPSVSTKMIVELSPLDTQTPLSKKVEHLFYNSWLDQTKVSRFENIILFDIKTVPSQPDGQPLVPIKAASRDVELLTLLGDFPLRFSGARRACCVGDVGYPLILCGNVECAICSVFREQYAARKAGIRFESGPKIPTSSSSSKSDDFITNHHIHSSQYAMVLCACPNTARSDPQTMFLDPDAPPPYTASASLGAVVVPIGLIIYTRSGWRPS